LLRFLKLLRSLRDFCSQFFGNGSTGLWLTRSPLSFLGCLLQLRCRLGRLLGRPLGIIRLCGIRRLLHRLLRFAGGLLSFRGGIRPLLRIQR